MIGTALFYGIKSLILRCMVLHGVLVAINMDLQD